MGCKLEKQTQTVYFWFNQGNIRVNLHFPVVKQRFMDIYIQSNFEQINCSCKCKEYMHIMDHFTLQYYLTKTLPVKYKKQIHVHVIT